MTFLKKTALVTGGAHGIGRAITEALLLKGAQVVVLDINSEYLSDLGNAHTADTLLPIQCDVGNEQDVCSALNKLKDSFGALDYVVNNAGISAFKPLGALSWKEWERILSVNLGSVFLTTKYAKPLFRDGKGAMVNIASTRALMSEPHTEAYSASKGGMVALSHALAISLGPGIRVNCVSPGWIHIGEKYGTLTEADHAQHPCGRVGTPGDIENMVLYLLSDGASFITGQNFVVDGGMTRKMIYE